MPKDYLWDSRAAKQIALQKLDKFYDKHRGYYAKLASDGWATLQEVNSGALKHDDLYDVLLPLILRDGRTETGMSEASLPKPLARGAAQWYSWFTHYIVEQHLQGVGGATQ